MTSKERVFASVNHEEPDRIPLMYRDVPEVRARLKKDLNVSTDDELFKLFGIDFRWVAPVYSGPEMNLSETERRDYWGVEWAYSSFSDSAGYWNETKLPMKEIDSIEELASRPLPELDWWDFTTLKAQCESCKDFAVMSAPGFASPGILQYPIQSLIGVERSLTDPYINPEFFTALIDHILEFQLPFIRKMMEEAGGGIDFFRLGDDFGTQQSLLMGTEPWKQFIAPALCRMADLAKTFGARYYQHSCGAVRALIPELIEIGVDVLDPMQVKAEGMIPSELKEEFGDRLCFSGGVDEQELLPNGTADEVREAVWRLLDQMSGGGGFILGPTHNFQDDIPTANIVAMYKAAADWKG